jgi:hypothetical protein
LFTALSLVVFVFAFARHIKKGADWVFFTAVGLGASLLMLAIAFGSSFDSPRSGVLAELIVGLLRVFAR